MMSHGMYSTWLQIGSFWTNWSQSNSGTWSDATRKQAERALWMWVYVRVWPWLQEREPGKRSWSWSECESTNKTFEGSKNSSSWKNIYALKDSHCGKTSPFFIKTKWNSMRDMASWREARPKWEHQCINKYVGQVEMYSVKKGHGKNEKAELPKQRQNTQTQALPFFLISWMRLVTHTWKCVWYLFHLCGLMNGWEEGIAFAHLIVQSACPNSDRCVKPSFAISWWFLFCIQRVSKPSPDLSKGRGHTL